MTGPQPQDGEGRPSRWRADGLRLDPSSPYYVPPPSARRLRLWRVFLTATPIPVLVVVTVVCLVHHYWWFALFYAFMLLTFGLLRREQLTRIRTELRGRDGEPGRRTGS